MMQDVAELVTADLVDDYRALGGVEVEKERTLQRQNQSNKIMMIPAQALPGQIVTADHY